MKMEHFGHVATIRKESWDWETCKTETMQKRLATCQASKKYLLDVNTQCFWQKMDQCGQQDSMETENWVILRMQHHIWQAQKRLKGFQKSKWLHSDGTILC